MTKVQVRYEFTRPFDDSLLEVLDRAHGTYGLHRLLVASDGLSLTVEFDASRLTTADVDNALQRAGLPVVRKG